MSTYQLSQIHIYPIKSLGGIALTTAKVEARGLQYDRRWMLVDKENNFLTQREHHQLALFQVSIEGDALIVAHPSQHFDDLRIPLKATPLRLQTVHIWKDTCPAYTVSSVANDWFSEALQSEVSLVYMPEISHRKVDAKYAVTADDVTSFSDGFPFLIIGQASLDDLNHRLDVPIPMNRFRPNFVFTHGTPYEEDNWQRFSIGNVPFFAVKPCARCVLTTINQNTGMAGKEPLRTLATYRKKENNVLFGQNLIATEFGNFVSVGDTITILP